VLKRELAATGHLARVTYYDTGDDREALVFANGLGGPLRALHHQLRHFGGRYRVITWDYRGLYASRDRVAPQRVDVGAHADDLLRVLDQAGVERAALVGWSMGVPVVLDTCARFPERVSRLVLISGAPRRPFGSTRVPGVARLAAPLIEVSRAVEPLGQPLVGRLLRSRTLMRAVRRLGMVSPTIDTDELLELAAHVTTLDLDVYLRTLRALDDYDATIVLARLATPTLVIGGGRDLFMPPPVTRRLAALAKAEMYLIPEATHYAPAEFPELVNARIDAFLSAEAGSPPSRGRGR
jgi:pimeloyl-ACP methyl ester carboxylesterase